MIDILNSVRSEYYNECQYEGNDMLNVSTE